MNLRLRTCGPGRVAERLIAPVLKTGRPKGLVSSNLTPSAISISDSRSPIWNNRKCATTRAHKATWSLPNRAVDLVDSRTHHAKARLFRSCLVDNGLTEKGILRSALISALCASLIVSACSCFWVFCLPERPGAIPPSVPRS